MTRMTITLPERLKDRAEMQAKREKKSLGRYIRESLEKRLEDKPPHKIFEDALFTDFEVFEDDWPRDVSSNIDKYLDEDFVKRKLQ